MAQVNDKVLSAVVLVQRIIPRLNADDRSTIKRAQLLSIQQSISMALQQLNGECTQPLVLTPLMNVVELINNVISDDTFVETDAETKSLIVENMGLAMNQLYIFAGHYYMDHEFTFSMAKSDVLRTIVKVCVDEGFYFGEDDALRKEGLL